MALDYKPEIFSPKQLRSWWLIPVLMVTGALVGLFFSFFQKPIYEATATVTTNFEINPSEEITEIMLDGALYHIGDLAFYSPVIAELIQTEKVEGISLNLEMLRDISAVERRLNSTLIKVKWNDPRIAARIASSWVEILYGYLLDGYQNALLAEDLAEYQEKLETCMIVGENSEINCEFSEGTLEQEIEYLSNEIANKRSLSLGLHPNLFISQFQPASIPEKPLYFGRGTLILSGSFIGLAVSLIIIETKKSKKNAQ